MRALVLPFCFLVSLPSFAAGMGQDGSAYGALNGVIAKGFQKGFGEPVMASSNRYLVEVQFLAERKLKVSTEPRCNAYVDLTLAASQATGYTPAEMAARKKRVLDSLTRGWQASCYVKKTPLEAMPYGLRIFWEPRHAKLSPAPACAPFVNQSNKIAFSENTEMARKLALSELYVAATQRGCVQN